MKMNKKNILSLSLLAGAAVVFTGCAGEEEDLFSSSAAERLTMATAEYTGRLADMGGKWTMEYYPTNGDEAPQGLGYLMLLDFNADQSVKVAMNNNFTGNVYKEDVSVWEMIADNGPVLTFNTYNECLHAFSDPKDIGFTTSRLEDETGLGAEGDYEFMVLSLDDKATEGMLKGKKRGVYDRIIRLPEDTDFETYIADVQAFHNSVFPKSAPNYVQLNYTDVTMRIDEGNGGMPNIYVLGTDAIVNESRHPFLITKHDGIYRLRFRNEMQSKGGDRVQEFVYDAENQVFNAVGNSGATITGPVPTDFFMSWMQDSNGKWQYTVSASGQIKAVLDILISDLRKYKYTFQDLQLAKDGDNISATFSFKNGNKNGRSVFLYNVTTDGDAVVMDYVGPKDNASGTMLTNIPSMGDVLEALSAAFTAVCTRSPFDASVMRLTSRDDAGNWIEFTFKK